VGLIWEPESLTEKYQRKGEEALREIEEATGLPQLVKLRTQDSETLPVRMMRLTPRSLVPPGPDVIRFGEPYLTTLDSFAKGIDKLTPTAPWSRRQEQDLKEIRRTDPTLYGLGAELTQLQNDGRLAPATTQEAINARQRALDEYNSTKAGLKKFDSDEPFFPDAITESQALGMYDEWLRRRHTQGEDAGDKYLMTIRSQRDGLRKMALFRAAMKMTEVKGKEAKRMPAGLLGTIESFGLGIYEGMIPEYDVASQAVGGGRLRERTGTINPKVRSQFYGYGLGLGLGTGLSWLAVYGAITSGYRGITASRSLATAMKAGTPSMQQELSSGLRHTAQMFKEGSMFRRGFDSLARRISQYNIVSEALGGGGIGFKASTGGQAKAGLDSLDLISAGEEGLKDMAIFAAVPLVFSGTGAALDAFGYQQWVKEAVKPHWKGVMESTPFTAYVKRQAEYSRLWVDKFINRFSSYMKPLEKQIARWVVAASPYLRKVHINGVSKAIYEPIIREEGIGILGLEAANEKALAPYLWMDDLYHTVTMTEMREAGTGEIAARLNPDAINEVVFKPLSKALGDLQKYTKTGHTPFPQYLRGLVEKFSRGDISVEAIGATGYRGWLEYTSSAIKQWLEANLKPGFKTAKDVYSLVAQGERQALLDAGYSVGYIEGHVPHLIWFQDDAYARAFVLGRGEPSKEYDALQAVFDQAFKRKGYIKEMMKDPVQARLVRLYVTGQKLMENGLLRRIVHRNDLVAWAKRDPQVMAELQLRLREQGLTFDQLESGEAIRAGFRLKGFRGKDYVGADVRSLGDVQLGIPTVFTTQEQIEALAKVDAQIWQSFYDNPKAENAMRLAGRQVSRLFNHLRRPQTVITGEGLVPKVELGEKAFPDWVVVPKDVLDVAFEIQPHARTKAMQRINRFIGNLKHAQLIMAGEKFQVRNLMGDTIAATILNPAAIGYLPMAAETVIRAERADAILRSTTPGRAWPKIHEWLTSKEGKRTLTELQIIQETTRDVLGSMGTATEKQLNKVLPQLRKSLRDALPRVSDETIERMIWYELGMEQGISATYTPYHIHGTARQIGKEMLRGKLEGWRGRVMQAKRALDFTLLEPWEAVSTVREKTGRLALWYAQVVDMARGGTISIKDLPSKWIDIEGLRPLQAAGKTVSEIMVDYGNAPEWARRQLSGLWAPFWVWYYHTARNWTKTLLNPITLSQSVGKYFYPYYALTVWNNTNFPEVEASLQDYQRSLLHYITPIKDDKGRQYVHFLETPYNSALETLGFEPILNRLPALQRGELTAEEVKDEYLEYLSGERGFTSIPQLEAALNQGGVLVDAIYALATNKDQFTGRSITRRLDKPYEKAYKYAEYFVNQVTPPLIEYQRTAEYNLDIPIPGVSPATVMGKRVLGTVYRRLLDPWEAADIRPVWTGGSRVWFDAKFDLSDDDAKILDDLEEQYVKGHLYNAPPAYRQRFYDELEEWKVRVRRNWKLGEISGDADRYVESRVNTRILQHPQVRLRCIQDKMYQWEQSKMIQAKYPGDYRRMKDEMRELVQGKEGIVIRSYKSTVKWLRPEVLRRAGIEARTLRRDGDIIEILLEVV